MPRVAEYRLKDFNHESIEKFTQTLIEVATTTLMSYGNAKIYFEPDPINGMLLVVVADASEEISPPANAFKLEEKYLKAYYDHLERDDIRARMLLEKDYVPPKHYWEQLAENKGEHIPRNWAQEIPQCPQCSGVAAADQDEIVHHKGHRQNPYGMPCVFKGSKNEWLNHLASITPCPICKKKPVVDKHGTVMHNNPDCRSNYKGTTNPRGWLRRVEEFVES